MNKANSPIVFHPLVSQFVNKLSHNALKLLLFVGSKVFKANNRTVSVTKRKDVKAAHVLIQRKTILVYCGITESEWEQAVQELDKLDLMWVTGRNASKLDRYFLLSPNKHYVKGTVFYNRSQIPKTFKGETNE